MRALCGAIITAGSLIGLGLTIIGYGQRYSTSTRAAEGYPIILDVKHMDGPFLPSCF
jgi:hypothetical protein